MGIQMLNTQQPARIKIHQAAPAIRPQHVNIKTVFAITTLCRSVIYKLIREGKFPAGRTISGTNRRVWALEEVEQFMSDSVQ